MASSEVEVERCDLQLKRLGFVRVLAINAAVVVSNLYDHAKQNSGSLKSTVCKVENAVTAVVGPFYERFKGFPVDLLLFLDNKHQGKSIDDENRTLISHLKSQCLEPL